MSDAGRNSAEKAATADLSGRQLGDLRLLRRLGRGAMADVYLAEQCRLKRRVAVKILKPALAEDQTYLKRFEREAQAAASLVHANIVQIHEVGHAEGLHYIVQEYVAGLNLRQWIARYGPADLGRAVSIMRQTAAGLAKATDAGVVHRDIKPENIMLTSEGEVKVADFGLARLAGDTHATELTQVGMTMGTPLYMSPEQVEGKPLDCRSDLYSFGVTCYQMLTGNPPFLADSALGVAVQHLKREPAALESQRPDLPPALCRIVHKMLIKDPAGRWQSPRQVLRELRRVQQQYCSDGGSEDSGVWQSSAVLPADPRLEASRQLARVMKTAAVTTAPRRRWLPAVALAAMFAAGGALAWLTLRTEPLLDISQTGHVRVPPQPTALAQYFCASQIGTEEAWRSVLEYFPKKESVVRRAKQQLARIYLREKDYDRALAIFDELAASTDADKEYRAWGLTGKVGVLAIEGKYSESAEALDELWPIRGELRDGQMQKLLRVAVKEINSHLGPQDRKQFDRWLKTEFHATP
jgi:serine/threonine-protein kinase